MKNILVPVDFSDASGYALEVAAKIARQQQAGITVLHMLGLSEAVLAKDEAQEYEEARFYMKLVKDRFALFLDKPYLKGIPIHQMLQNYKIFSELNNVAREQQTDLIVMGSQGKHGSSNFFGGSNTEKVVRTSDVPVLVIKGPNPDLNIRNILFASNFEDDSVRAYKQVTAFAKKFGAGVKLLLIITPYDGFMSSSEARKRIADFMLKAGEPDKAVEVYNDYSIQDGFLNYAKKENFDVMAIPTHGRKGLAHFFQGSIGEDVTNQANFPVLTLKINL